MSNPACLSCEAFPAYVEEQTSVNEAVGGLSRQRDALQLAKTAVLDTVHPIEENVLPHVLDTVELDQAEYVQAAQARQESKLDDDIHALTDSRAAADAASDDCTEEIQQKVRQDTSRAYDVCPRIRILRLLEESVDGEVR